jgi:hypothetical protein
MKRQNLLMVNFWLLKVNQVLHFNIRNIRQEGSVYSLQCVYEAHGGVEM